jgi:hypothetical protein
LINKILGYEMFLKTRACKDLILAIFEGSFMATQSAFFGLVVYPLAWLVSATPRTLTTNLTV